MERGGGGRCIIKILNILFTTEQCPLKMQDRMANSVEPNQVQSDLGLLCLPRHVCPKT